MSDTVHYVGTLTEVKPLKNRTLQETAKFMLDEMGYTPNEYQAKYYTKNYEK